MYIYVYCGCINTLTAPAIATQLLIFPPNAFIRHQMIVEKLTQELYQWLYGNLFSLFSSAGGMIGVREMHSQLTASATVTSLASIRLGFEWDGWKGAILSTQQPRTSNFFHLVF